MTTTVSAEHTRVGDPVARVDAAAKVRGEAVYSAEFRPDGLVHAAIVGSPVAAGTIRSIDTAAAGAAEGVLLVLTHENADRIPWGETFPAPSVLPASGEQLRVLADATVRFAGQPVAVVVADTQTRADHAAGLVRVDVEPEPAPLLGFDVERARPASEAAAKRGRGPQTTLGDIEAGLAASSLRVEGTYVLPREHHNAMEPHATIAAWHDDRLIVWTKTQWVGGERDHLAAVFGLAPDDVHVVDPYIGGAFGSGLRSWPHVVLAAMAARRLDRPVRLELTRRQLYTNIGFRPHTEQHVVLGADADGRLLAHVHEAVGQTSTYEEFAEAILDAALSTYPSRSRRATYRLVPMHTGTPTPMRGPGHATGLLAQETAMDELAVALGLDPIELRLRNFADTNPATGKPWSSNRLRQCYNEGAALFGWADRDRRPRSTTIDGRLAGVGMATAMNLSPRYPAQASVELRADGRAVVRCASSDMGAGTYTMAAHIAADALRLPIERVTVELGDSTYPKAMEHGGSTTTASVGSAVQAACEQLRAQLEHLAPGYGISSMDPSAVLAAAALDRLEMHAATEPGDEATSHAAYSFGAVFAEVRVDPDTYEIRVPRILGVYDVGRVVSPTMVHSQAIGGMVGGIGMALLEEAEWDSTLGRVANATLAEYLTPVCADVIDLEPVFLDEPDPIANPLRTKGVAELTLCGVAPAIGNAVFAATGIRIRKFPITLDKLLLADTADPPPSMPR